MYLGLDLGTSGVKALLIDADQRIVGQANGALEVSRPHPNWSEQDPAHWIRATEEAIDKLKAENPQALSAVRGIGLSGQQHGATLVDASGSPLRPCLLWNDTRAWKEAAELDGDEKFRRTIGNIVFPGFTAPKTLWVKNNEPEVFAKVAKVLLPKDYLRFWLTGEYVSDMSDASGTGWLEIGERRWAPELLAATGLDESAMPSLVEGSEISAILKPELAARWGMKSDVVVAGGAGDNAASACGVGTVRPGTAFVSLGTSGVIFASNDRFLPMPESAIHAFCHALPNLWHQMGVILSATDTINWLSGITGRSPRELTDPLGTDLKAPTPTLFLPYLSGERTPHNDAMARGAFVGLAHQSDRSVLAQAVLEGVAYAFKDNLEALRAAGTELSRVTAVGGGSRSRYWLEVMATVLDLPVDLPADGDFGGAFGAARLGLIAAEGADPFAVCTAPETAETIEPRRDLSQAFADAYGRFRALYPAIKGVLN